MRVCFKFVLSYLLERNLKLGTKTHFESLVLQSNGLTRDQTVNSTFCKREHIKPSYDSGLSFSFSKTTKTIGESKLS